MNIPTALGAGSIAIASGLSRARRGGVIINEHVLTAAQARHHVEVLGRHFDFIHHDDLLDRLARPRARPFCLLTFDDGKRSVATEAAPALERLGVPAVVYVVTRFLSEGFPLWFDRRKALARALGAPPRGLERETLIELPYALLADRLDRAEDDFGVRPDLHDDDVRAMSWEEARDLGRRGFTIGAHSLNHCILTREPLAEATANIEQSIREVAAEMGAPCETFAFPNGNYTARLARCAMDCGVRTVLTTEPMWADARFPAWRLPRVELFGEYSRAEIEFKLALAATGRVLANPDGTRRLYRKITRDQRRRMNELRRMA